MWRDNFTNEELKEIDTAIVNEVMNPFADYRGYFLIAKMAALLDQMEECHEDRNLLAMLAGRLSLGVGYPSGLGVDPDEPEWPVLFIELPNGQISYHLPADAVEGLWPVYRPSPELIGKLAHDGIIPEPNGWDGSDNEAKRARIRFYAR